MAQVHEYAIIASGLTYKSKGVSHSDALRTFIVNPLMVTGFHEGNYVAQKGEEFIVIGHGDEGPLTVERLVAVESTRFLFKRPEQVIRERQVADSVWVKWFEDRDREYEVAVNYNPRIPPYDLTGVLEIRLDLGIRVNEVWVPWSHVEDITPVTRKQEVPS